MTTSGNITPPSRPGAILQSLIGSWAIERRVDDMATLTGSVNFERSAENEAVYHETGTLRLSTGYEAAAERKYIYRQCGDGLAVFFDERPPRLFHMVKLIRDGDGYLIWPWFFCPEERLRERADRDQVPYPSWADGGFITPTPGNVVDFRSVQAHIRELCARFNVREIAFDPYLARNMMNELGEDGLPAVEMRQGFITMAPAVKELERAIVAEQSAGVERPVIRHADLGQQFLNQRSLPLAQLVALGAAIQPADGNGIVHAAAVASGAAQRKSQGCGTCEP